MESLQSIPLPPASTIPLPPEEEPKLMITSTSNGERSVSTVVEGDKSKTHKEKKKHKKEKHKHKHKHKSKDKKKDHPLITPQVLSQHASAIKAAMLKEVQSESKDNELSQTIVDDLFKDFLASKMNEIESAYKQAIEKQGDKEEVANSVQEMNKLLDDELDSISQNTPSPAKKISNVTKEPKSVVVETKLVKKISKDQNLCEEKPDIEVKSIALPPEPPVKVGIKSNLNLATNKTPDVSEKQKPDVKDTDSKTSENSENKVIRLDSDKTEIPTDKQSVPLEIKKPGKLQFSFKISQSSAELISSGSKVEDVAKKSLEEGEVMSSGHGSSSDSDSANGDDEGEVSETGSLSDSDKDKSKKKKKKKKHKKKKKKHKTSKDKDQVDNKNKRKHSAHRSRSRSKSPKKHRRSRTLSVEKRKNSGTPSKETRKRSRSKSFSPEHGVWRHKSPKDKERSRSFSPEHGVWRSSKHRHDTDRSRERESKSHYRDRDYDKHHRNHDRYDRDRRRESDKQDSERRYGKWRSRSRSRDRKKDRSGDDLRLKIDKAKLREIAMKNALAMAKSGQAGIPGMDYASIKAGGKSIDELTEFCARIAAKEKLKNRPPGLTSSSSSDEDGKKSDDEELIHHPFKVSDKSITMNIRNATAMPIMTSQEKITQQATLRMQFPVSSGNVHRTKEIEWVPVEKTETIKTSTVTGTTMAVALVTSTSTGTTTVATPALPVVATEVKLMPVREEDKVFTEPSQEPVDISSIISERIKAARQLAENPKDTTAMTALQRAQHRANLWANSKNLPGKFIGSTGAQILSQEELMGPDKRRQAWAKKDQFNKAAPVKGGIGMALLQKMGWQKGTGLGKNNEGSLEPLALDFKMDRKGLTSQDEHRPSKRVANAGPIRKDLSGKHPVSALVELCNKRRWASPDFQIVHEGGPDHKKNFLFKVVVNGVEYQPCSASQNKKAAKAEAAAAVLKEMGLIPKDS